MTLCCGRCCFAKGGEGASSCWESKPQPHAQPASALLTGTAVNHALCSPIFSFSPVAQCELKVKLPTIAFAAAPASLSVGPFRTKGRGSRMVLGPRAGHGLPWCGRGDEAAASPLDPAVQGPLSCKHTPSCGNVLIFNNRRLGPDRLAQRMVSSQIHFIPFPVCIFPPLRVFLIGNRLSGTF